MLRSNAAERRVPAGQEPGVYDDAEDQEILAELLNMPGQKHPTRLDDFAEALAAELDSEIASMNRVDPVTGRVSRPSNARKPSYDPWDDDALDEFLNEAELSGYDLSAPDMNFAPPQQGQGEEQSQGRRRFGLIGLVAGIALAGSLGVAGWMVLSGGAGLGEAPFVKAPTTPFKVAPDPSVADATPTQEGEAVFDSVGGVPAKSEERLVTRNEQVPELPSVTPQVSRVTLPDGRQVDADLPAGIDPTDTGARRVRTVLVRPDGTLIENPDSAPGASMAQPSQPQQPSVMDAIAAADPSVPQSEDGTSASGLPPLASTNQTTPPDPAPQPPVIQSVTQPAPVAGQTGEAPAMPDATAAVPTMTNVPLPTARPPVPRATAQAADANGPLDLAAAAQTTQPAPAAVAAPQPVAQQQVAEATPAPAVPASTGGSAAYVQLSSQRSEDAALAAFRSLQKKFPSVLSGVTPEVQKADLGAKGIYYRVKIGKASKADAVSFCQSLKDAGGDCLITR
ncbi:SPOR domain-containing protein [Oryzibacter oryziterrae]|uniref:SPOR domain-containing protein n=1 Tax=Oryzibacter oryziterrae TaxID=2766474 RepID=UPI001F0161B4|nr:SPOR domain-containing protein [Oryzibacter oryziterrae]